MHFMSWSGKLFVWIQNNISHSGWNDLYKCTSQTLTLSKPYNCSICDRWRNNTSIRYHYHSSNYDPTDYPMYKSTLSWWSIGIGKSHYIDVKMTTMASQITSLTFVYSTVYSDADQRKHQSSASLAFVWGIHRTKGQLRGKCFHLMTSSWRKEIYGWPGQHGQHLKARSNEWLWYSIKML